MWVKAVGAPADSFPLEIDDHQVRIYDIKRVLPANCSAAGSSSSSGGGCVHPVTGVPGGMVWNVTGVLSFSHGSWELAPRHEYDFEGVAPTKPLPDLRSRFRPLRSRFLFLL